jgi:Ni,Fe-hydrogenase III component G
MSAYELIDEWDIRGEYWNRVVYSLYFDQAKNGFILLAIEDHWHDGVRGYMTLLSYENARGYLNIRLNANIEDNAAGETAARIRELINDDFFIV